MKKLVLVAAAFVMIAGMTSCKKDHSCVCTGTLAGTYDLGKTSSSDATTLCNVYAITGNTCTVK